MQVLEEKEHKDGILKNVPKLRNSKIKYLLIQHHLRIPLIVQQQKKIILTDYLNRQSGQFAIKELIDIKKIKTIVPIFHKTKK
jgi:hypothetical protein